MKEIGRKTTTQGKVRVVVELDSDEALMSVRDSGFYRLGYPLDDVVPAHIVQNATRVHWDVSGQAWEQAE